MRDATRAERFAARLTWLPEPWRRQLRGRWRSAFVPPSGVRLPTPREEHRSATAWPPAPAPAVPGAADGPIQVVRWRRHTLDRLHASLAGQRLGWMDVDTGALHLDVADADGSVETALRARLAEVCGDTSRSGDH